MDFNTLPLPLEQKWCTTGAMYIVYGNIKSEDSQQKLCPETVTKLYVQEFGFWTKLR